MIRSLVAALCLATAAAVGIGCNAPVCGPGTKQVQKPDGTLECHAADDYKNEQCDVDGGAIIQGGICTSRTQCGDNTEPQMQPDGRILCVGVGGVARCGCAGVDPGKICVRGELYDFETNMKSSKQVRFRVFDPLAFLDNPNTTPLVPELISDEGCYVFQNVPRPTTGLVAVAVDDPAGVANPEFQLTGSGAQVPTAQKNYTVDVYHVSRSTVQGWSTQTGIDWAGLGTYIAFFYDEPLPVDETDFSNSATATASGVQLIEGGAVPMNARYFGASRTTIDPAATATSAVGGALTTSPPGITTFSGMGGTCTDGPCMWPTNPGSSVSGLVFISRFHRN